MIDVTQTPIAGVVLIHPRVFRDSRGWFSETFRQSDFAAVDEKMRFVQDNASFSVLPGTIRGLHYQIAQGAQAKLVRCARGRILDVVVDLRRSSTTFGKHAGFEISAADGMQLYVPVGLAHGFCTLDPNCEVHYKVTAEYDPTAERGIAFDDPALAINWPVVSSAAIVSERDRQWPRLEQIGPSDLF